MNKTIIIFGAVMLIMIMGVNGATYYIDCAGSDSNDGLTTGTAWATLGKADSAVSNSKILFKRGCIWSNQYMQWVDKNNINLSTYGSGAFPLLDGRANYTNWDTASNWTEISTNVWRYVSTASASPTRLWLNGTEYAQAKNNYSMNKYYRWAYNTTTDFLHIYSTSNPATAFNEMKALSTTVSRTADFYDCNNFIVENLNITGGRLEAIAFFNSSRMWFRDMAIGANSKRGLNIGGQTPDSAMHNRFINITFDSSYTTDNTYNEDFAEGAFIYRGSYNNTIDSCTFRNWGHGAIYLKCDSTAFPLGVSYNYITNNYISSPDINYSSGVSIDGFEGQAENNLVDSNTITYTTVANQFNGNNNTFSNNIVSNLYDSPRKLQATSYALEMASYSVALVSHNNIISGNTFSNINDECIRIKNYNAYGGAGNHTISGNIFSNCAVNPVSVNEGVAIFLDNDATIKTWSNNNIGLDTYSPSYSYQYQGIINVTWTTSAPKFTTVATTVTDLTYSYSNNILDISTDGTGSISLTNMNDIAPQYGVYLNGDLLEKTTSNTYDLTAGNDYQIRPLSERQQIMDTAISSMYGFVAWFAIIFMVLIMGITVAAFGKGKVNIKELQIVTYACVMSAILLGLAALILSVIATT